MDEKTCEWLLTNADVPIRYRVTRELLRETRSAQSMEKELVNIPVVAAWLHNLKPQSPPQHCWTEHGSFNYCLENAIIKAVQLGLHAGLPQVQAALAHYTDKMNTAVLACPVRNWDTHSGFDHILMCNLLSLAEVEHETVSAFMRQSLDELHCFVRKGDYDIYYTSNEMTGVKGLPKIWADRKVIRQDLLREHGFFYPLIYDIVGLHTQYKRNDPEMDRKINAVIDYITTDIFHETMADGYGIIPADDGKCYAMGWDPKYPGWFHAAEYLERRQGVSRLLFFMQYIAKYPAARRSRWFGDVLFILEQYRTDSGTYRFPPDWLKESQGYAVMGSHMAFGENRRKSKWCEVESTFYMQLLSHSMQGGLSG